jgi:GNAT superfamily N-acetyltransferase
MRAFGESVNERTMNRSPAHVECVKQMDIRIAVSGEDIKACYVVMRELRPHLSEREFLARVELQSAAGYALAAAWRDARPVAVAGYRVVENLASGRILYVDDLVTLASERSKGHGAALLGWLKEKARALGCAQLQLDSGVQRLDAHRFYEREGMTRSGYYFQMAVDRGASDVTAG